MKDLPEVAEAFRAWDEAKRALEDGQKWARNWMDRPNYRPHFRVTLRPISVRDGTAESTAVAGAAISDSLEGRLNARAAEIVAEELTGLGHKAEELRREFLRVTMKAVADGALAPATIDYEAVSLG